MSKSFKNILNKEPSIIPESKKDILDIFQEEREGKENSVTVVTPKFVNEQTISQQSIPQDEIEPNQEQRQTFIIGNDYLENIKDYVHTKRISGSYQYTQKNALHDALDLLFKDIEIIKRPEEIRKQEENRSLKIKKGIKIN